jgi:putative hydrolase of the HAD superfamily
LLLLQVAAFIGATLCGIEHLHGYAVRLFSVLCAFVRFFFNNMLRYDIMRKEIEGVAFDLDGTLYPNYRLNIKLIPFAFKEMPLLAAFGRARMIIREEQKNGDIQHTDFYNHQAEITAQMLKAPVEVIKEKIDALIYKGWEPLFKTVEPYRYVFETLTALHNSGYKLGLLSDFPPEKKLEYLGLSGFWDVINCSEYSGALKPHPLSFTKLIDQMNLPPEKILYVGNSLSYDVVGAAKAGMKTAWISFIPPQILIKSEPKPDFSFYSYRQLFDYMLH